MSEGEGKKGRVCHVGMGSSIHVQRWVNYFAEKGWEVHLVTFNPVDTNKLDSRVIQHTISPPNISGLGFIYAMVKVHRTMKKIKPSLVHAHSIPSYGIYVGISSKLARKWPFVQTAWGYWHVLHFRGIKQILNKNALKQADHITTLTDFMKNLLVKTYKIQESKFHVFPWGIDNRYFYRGYSVEVKELKKKIGIPEDHFIIISTRELNPHFNVDVLLDALSKILRKNPKVTLIILRAGGSLEYENRLKYQAGKLGIIDNIAFVPDLIPFNEMPIWLNLSDISVMLPITDQGPLSIHEAMICGCILIASDIEPNREYIQDGENGFLVPFTDPQSLSNKILLCMEQSELNDKFYRKNKTFIESNSTWQKNSYIMEDIYDKAIESFIKKRKGG